VSGVFQMLTKKPSVDHGKDVPHSHPTPLSGCCAASIMEKGHLVRRDFTMTFR